jgi:MoaA/NifB/PqqE/SkfB family radical SAM enzyme
MSRQFSTHRIVCWRITTHCNRACPFCLSRSNPRRTHPSEEPGSVVRRLKELGAEKISYTGGEPLTYPGFGDVVRYADHLGIRQVVTTNGDALGSDAPDWFALLEHLKLSFYGSRGLHDSMMGSGHYDKLLRLATELTIPVSANYMLTQRSVTVVPEFLRDCQSAGMHDVVFQTYIRNGRRSIDLTLAFGESDRVLSRISESTRLFQRRFHGGLRLHDYAQRDWFIVLDETGRLTLPTSDGSPDFSLGEIRADWLDLPDGTRLASSVAMEWVWQTRASTRAIVDLD